MLKVVRIDSSSEIISKVGVGSGLCVSSGVGVASGLCVSSGVGVASGLWAGRNVGVVSTGISVSFGKITVPFSSKASWSKSPSFSCSCSEDSFSVCSCVAANSFKVSHACDGIDTNKTMLASKKLIMRFMKPSTPLLC